MRLLQRPSLDPTGPAALASARDAFTAVVRAPPTPSCVVWPGHPFPAGFVPRPHSYDALGGQIQCLCGIGPLAMAYLPRSALTKAPKSQPGSSQTPHPNPHPYPNPDFNPNPNPGSKETEPLTIPAGALSHEFHSLLQRVYAEAS